MWKTSISKIEPNKIVVKGYKIENLIGNVPFSHLLFLLLKNRLPNENEGKMIDAILTSSIDHGVTPPTTIAARLIASSGVPLPTAVAGGLLAVGDFHGGAIEDCAKLLQEWSDKGETGEIAKKIIEETKKEGKRIPGLGHRVHKIDPRTTRLFELADELGIAGKNVALIKAISERVGLTINVDGAIGAIISDMNFDYKIGKAFFLISRCMGLIAHVYEEMTREKPMRKLVETEVEYDGPWER